MKKIEKDLLDGIKEADQDREKYKEQIRKLEKQITNTETKLIEATLQRDRLTEQLRVYRNSLVKVQLTERDQEIEDFRAKYPDLCSKNEEP